MITLANRATLRQQKVMRIINGACRDAANAHPEWKFEPHWARSISKRATGTLTASWPEVLAMPQALSERAHHPARPDDRSGGHGVTGNSPWLGRASRSLKRSPALSYIQRSIGALAGEMKRSGDQAGATALVEALRLVAKIRETPFDQLPKGFMRSEKSQNPA